MTQQQATIDDLIKILIMSSSISLPVQQIPIWLKHVFVGGAVFFFCWGGAIAYWRMNRSAPGAAEIGFYLLALPAALLLLFWGGGKAMASRASAPASRQKTRPAPADPVPGQAPPLAILAAALRSPHGASVEELAQAIAANKVRAELDRELVDGDGFPVMTARSIDAGDDMLREEISEWLLRNGMGALQLNEEEWRALTLASAVTSDLVMRATDELVTPDRTAPMLQLMPVLPSGWPFEHRRAAGMWLRHTAGQFGWPFDRVVLAADAVDARPAAVFARLAQAADHPTPALTLVVACASHIGQQSVDDWAARGILCTASQAQGVIPGEGAAGLLVANLALARSIESMAYVLLDRFEETRLEASSDQARRIDAAPLGKLVEAACKHAGIGAADIAMVIGDADHRPNRILELMGLVSTALPRLDTADEVVRVGPVYGSCGAVPFLTGLALARYYTVDSEAPTLFASNEDPYQRCVAVVRSALTLPLF